MKWEHCRLFITNQSDVYVQFYRANESPRHVGRTGLGIGSNNDALPGYIEMLGRDGWELVTIVSTDAPDVLDRLTMYFKRQVTR